MNGLKKKLFLINIYVTVWGLSAAYQKIYFESLCGIKTLNPCKNCALKTVCLLKIEFDVYGNTEKRITVKGFKMLHFYIFSICFEYEINIFNIDKNNEKDI